MYDTIGCADDKFAKTAKESGNKFDTRNIELPTNRLVGLTIEETGYR